MNTALHYLYRDAANYKQGGFVVFAGEITEADRATLLAALDDGTYFIAEQVGVESLRERWGTLDDDHVWHVLSEVALVADPPTDPRSIADFVAQIADTTWDVERYAAELAARLAAQPTPESDDD